MTAKRILVVEDDPSTRQAWQELIKNWGFDVAVAEDGVTALTQVASYNPDIMLLDLRLPRKDGLTVLRELHDRGVTIKETMEVRHGTAVMEMVKVALGVALVPRWVAREDVQAGSLIPLSLPRTTMDTKAPDDERGI